MSLQEITGHRSLAFSGYHRTLPNDWAAIDVDLALFCPKCYHTVALVETTGSPSYFQKPCGVLEKMADDLQIPAYLLHFKLVPLDDLPDGAPETLDRFSKISRYLPGRGWALAYAPHDAKWAASHKELIVPGNILRLRSSYSIRL